MAEMNVIKCPGCNSSFRLKASNPAALASRMFKCPKCNYSAPFPVILNRSGIHGAPKPVLGGDLKTHIANVGSNGRLPGGEHLTRRHTPVTPGAQAALVVDKTGRRFPLAVGIYILGRDSQDSLATLRLAPDQYMSRQHARLTVNALGGKVQCSLCGLSSLNPIYVNNVKLQNGASAVLKNGDKLLLGMTTVTVVMQ